MFEAELELEALLEDLMSTLTRSNLEAEAELFDPGSAGQALSVRAQQIIWPLIARGVRDENQLTDAVFFDRHPERQGRSLRNNEWALRREWIEIRDVHVRPMLFVANQKPPAPVPPPAPRPDSIDILALSPLPPSQNARFLRALDQLLLEVDAVVATDARAWRYLCWIQKLRQPDVDDRVIRWGSLCPGPGAYIPTRAWLGPCHIDEAIGPEQLDLLEKHIHSVDDVDRAPRWLRLVFYLKPEIVRAVEWNVALMSLSLVHDSVQRAIQKLDYWANLPLGGSSAMPTAYVAVKDWIAGRQRDPRSVYSCL